MGDPRASVVNETLRDVCLAEKWAETQIAKGKKLNASRILSKFQISHGTAQRIVEKFTSINALEGLIDEATGMLIGVQSTVINEAKKRRAKRNPNALPDIAIMEEEPPVK